MFNKSDKHSESVATLLLDSMLDQGNTTKISDNDWHILAKLSLVFSEYIGLILMTFGLVGMFKGIEISHPVYSVLFQNLCFNALVTLVNLLAGMLVPFQTWVRILIVTNYFGMLFHNTRFASCCIRNAISVT